MSNELTIPAFDNIDSYVNRVLSIPMLTYEREQELAKELPNSLKAAKELIYSHLKLVPSIARSFHGYGLPYEDLIQEGNIGLMQAVKRFDCSFGVRLSSYAIPWIKRHIQQYVIDNWRLVKIGTTKGLRKAFFNIRSLKAKLAIDGRVSTEQLAKELNIKPEEIIEAEKRMQFPVLLDQLPADADDSDTSLYDSIPELANRNCPLKLLIDKEKDKKNAMAFRLIENLDERSKDIIVSRYLADNPDTLSVLSEKHGVSMERIRQIEVKTLKQLKDAMIA